MKGDVVGKLFLVSTDTHSFLVYKSYINDSLNLHNFDAVYYYNNYNGLFDEQFAPVSDRVYNIKANKFITIGLSANIEPGDVLLNSKKDFYASILTGKSYTEGGIKCNWELYNYYIDNDDNQFPNLAIGKDITSLELECLLEYCNDNNYYSLINHNCAIVATRAWNKATKGLIIPTVLPSTLKATLGCIDGCIQISIPNIFVNIR